MRCFVYRNLRKPGHVYSIKALEGSFRGLVIGYAPNILLQDAVFYISKPGQLRARKQKQRNVHAGIIGNVTGVCGYTPRLVTAIGIVNDFYLDGGTLMDPISVTYNPYHWDTFVEIDTKQSVTTAAFVCLKDKRVLAFNLKAFHP
jgi:hypothetical protein